jgi:PKD repeat protein
MGIFRRLIPSDEEAVPFKVQVTTSSSNVVFTLPLVNYGTFTPNFSVNWGDASSGTVVSITDSNRIHTYVNPGVYTITITGFMPGWKVNNSSAIRSLIT